jgi:DNA-directed RNA polymerase specialized sigma24 family protein/opacity protein-like surface antigen
MKRLMIGLGVAIAMTFAGSAWAQVPPDVPPGHWAYDAIEELMRDGIIKGYPDGTFKGKAPLTRYEFAIAIRDALAAIRQQIDEVRAQIPKGQPTQPSQPTTPTQPQPGITAEERAKLQGIPADTAQRLQKLEEAMARINRLATEFQDELASLGVDVESAKRDLANLRRRLEAIEEELKRFRLSGDVTFVVRGTNSIDNRRAKDLNAQRTAVGGLLGNINVLHELGLNISSKLGETASADVSLVVGNWLPYLGSASQFVARPAATNTDIVLWKAAVNAPISVFGTEVNLTIGRFENRINPLTLWRPDVDVYTTIDRYDNGYYSMDGVKAAVGIGSVQIGLFAARNNTVNTNNGGNFMAVHGGIGNSTNIAAAHPSTAVVAGIGAFDSSAGATVEVNLGDRISLSGEVVTMKRATTNVALGNVNPKVNRLNVYGGHLKANLIDRLTITADYAQSDLLLQESNVNNKDNWALLVGVGYTFSETLSLSAGYREVRPYFAAPGYWGRIGYWHNPTDIKGADVALAWKLGAFAIDAKGGIYKGSNRPASFVRKDDEITHIAAGVLWNASEKLNLNVSYEGVLWNLKTSSPGRKPTENYVTLGVDYKVSDNALLKLLYQVVDFNANGVTDWRVNRDDKARAGVAVAQFSVKF